MVEVGVRVEGVKNLIRYIGEVPKRLDKELSRGNEQFMKDLRTSAKRRAPRDTGDLANSIKISKTKTKGMTKQWKLEVGSPYGVFQEFGFTPHATNKINPNSNKIGHLAGQLVWVGTFTPFVQPAFDGQILKLNGILDRYSTRGLRF